jgi:iron complex outermembrane receptor protein
MKKSIIFVCSCLPRLLLRRRNIRGKVCYEKDKSPVQFASVALVQLPDSAMITGVITLTDGGFSLEKVKPGNYFLKASFVGYKANGKKSHY